MARFLPPRPSRLVFGAKRAPRRHRFRSLALAGGVALGASPAGAEPAAPAFPEPLAPGALEATYEVYSGGFQALTLQLRFEGEGEAYAARFHARSDGFLSNFFTFRLDSEAEGRRTENGLRPARFRTEARWSDNDPRSVTLTYGADGSIAAEVVPPPQEDERASVPEDARAGTIDPISAVVQLIEQTARTGQCTGTARVFDGRRRLDLAATGRGADELPRTDYALYAGPATVCAVELTPVTGFWDGEERRERYPEELRVFLAEVVEGRPPLPVRLEMDIVARGAVRAHLTDLRVGEQEASR